MRTGVIFALFIALCVLLGPVGGSTPLAAPPSQASHSESGRSDTIIEIQLQQDGDARMSIVRRVPLRGENATAAYEQAASEFTVKSIEMEKLKTFFRRVVQNTSNATNRPMSIENIDRNTNLSDGVGRFTLSFTWNNFAIVVKDKSLIKLDDSFNTTSGTWLPGLPKNLTLVIRPPPGYHIRSSPISHQGQTLRWTGPHSFKPGFPNITYARSISGDQTFQSPTATPPPSGSGDAVSFSLSPVMLAVGAAVLIAIGSIGIFAFSRRKRVLTNVTTDGGVGAEGAGVSLSGTDPDSSSDPAPVLDPDTGSEPDTDTESSDDGIDLGLLSDEERVERLLQQNDGRMKQANIVRETDWSDAKVSQLLSAMDEAGRIEKLRIGRENLITLSDYDDDSD